MGKWTRRGFIAAGLVGGGVLAVGVGIREGQRAPKLAGLVTKDGESLVNVWVKLAPDNTVTAIVPHSEMGQGVFTSMTQMLADEMDADWDKVTFEQAPAHEGYANYPLGREFILGDTKVPGFVQDSLNGGFLRIAQSMGLQITGGSTAVRFTGMGGMRIAGAAAREMIVKAASKYWGVPANELRTEKSFVHHDESGRSEPYSSFAARAAEYAPPTQPTLKTPDQYKLMGTSLPRFDIPAKTDGTAEFGIDVDLPGMKYAAVMGPPVLGAETARVDDTYAADMPGVVKILDKGTFVAVVADGYWQAENAIRQLEIEWTKTGAETVNQSDIFAAMRTAIEESGGKGEKDVAIGNVSRANAQAARVYEAEYSVPFLAHAAMEPLNATAWVRDGQIDLWSGLQNPLAVRDEIAGAFDVKKDRVTVHNVMLGGGFGRRAMPDYPMMAVEIASDFDHPVKMIWSREQDTQQDWFRPASVSRFKAGLDENGLPVSWDNMFTEKHDPPEASQIPYKIDNQLIQYTNAEHHIRFGPWRSVDHTQHGFFIESFVDELADQAGMDGYEYRRKLLTHSPRYTAVLDAAAKAANWGRELPEGRGLGIALVDSFGTVVAQVVEVDVTGPEARVVHVWCAADPGYAMNPDGFVAQIESGIIYGLTAALYGDITIEDGAVAQSNFHDYPMLRIDQAPDISVEIINSGAKIGGGGEPGTPPIAPALANAVFAATGVRVRSQPIANFKEGLS
ncbi:MAG: molybdopterin cofactor-binding domain-containing protein [Pseudomonadota bacterium]